MSKLNTLAVTFIELISLRDNACKYTNEYDENKNSKLTKHCNTPAHGTVHSSLRVKMATVKAPGSIQIYKSNTTRRHLPKWTIKSVDWNL